MSATSSQPAIKFVASRHLGTKWCGWFSTTPKALFEPLISSGHFAPLISVVQFRPLIFRGSTGCFRPMICPLFGRKIRKIACIFRVFFVFFSCFLRVCAFSGSNKFVHKSVVKREKIVHKNVIRTNKLISFSWIFSRASDSQR